MANGFPEGNFRIINDGTGDRLYVQYGGTTEGNMTGTDKRTGKSDNISFSHTNDPVFKVGTPGQSDYDGWRFNITTGQCNRLDHYLMTEYKDTRSHFALALSKGTESVIPNQALMALESRFRTVDGRLTNPAISREWNEPSQFLKKMLRHIVDEEQRWNAESAFHCLQTAHYLGRGTNRHGRDDAIRKVLEQIDDEALKVDVRQACDSVRQEYRAAMQRYRTLTDDQRKALAEERKEALDAWQQKLGTAPRSASVTLHMMGSGQTGVSKWQTEAGYLFEEGRPDLVLTAVKSGDYLFLSFKTRGIAPNQTWSFEKK